MSLSSLQLDAFLEVARTGGFSKAARNLHLTQSALSQRILNLESELGVALLIREPSRVRLTPTGHELLRYCQRKQGLEEEFLEGLRSGGKPRLGGVIRIGGYSTVMRSVVLPALTPLIVAEPAVQIEYLEREMRDLPALLRHGEADFILLDHELERGGWKIERLGFEEYVLVEGRSGAARADVYLDHDVEDTTTEKFWKFQRRAVTSRAPAKRSFLDEIYAILDGVRAGWGRAVVPRHLVGEDSELEIVSGLRPMRLPVVLHYYEQPYYPRLHEAVIKALVERIPGLLSA